MVKQIAKKFGTAPVFLTAISTILGAIMFLRFGYAVGSIGLLSTLFIIIIGHLVTIPTAMALAEIATNQKVEGGGEYFIISRSFGLNIGATIGIALYLSQAISASFYIIAFAEAFDPIIAHFSLEEYMSAKLIKKIISLVALVGLGGIILKRGAGSGMNVLYVVVALLAASLLFFFLGDTKEAVSFKLLGKNGVMSGDNAFFVVFAIVFPAFTGMTAGVGLSGDLADPKKSIPMGTLAATLVGMVVYVFIAFKLAASGTAQELVDNQLIMQDVAIWSPIILIGLAAATVSSALGSVIVAPRTLQAIAGDKMIPNNHINFWLSRGKGKNNEPYNSSLITFAIALIFVLMGDVNSVASLISMFFMVTYGSICLISFLENFAGNPAYRPSFKSKWYLSLLGFVMCLYMMFKMNSGYAIAAILLMTGIYMFLSRYRSEEQGLANIFKGFIFQVSRKLHVFLQKAVEEENEENWRPSVICIKQNSFDHFGAFDLLRWISHKYGFGTFIHHIDGYLSKETYHKGKDDLKRLIKMTQISNSNVFVDTVVSPSYTSSIAQILQIPGVSGKENNTILFEFDKDNADNLDEIIENINLIKSVNFDVCILGSSTRKFGFRHEIHIWITSNDYQNANLMIFLAYILIGHPEWKNAVIKLFAIFPSQEVEEQQTKLLNLVKSGRLPISKNNITVLELEEDFSNKDLINKHSRDADLTIVGFRSDSLKRAGSELFSGYASVGNILFVNTLKEKAIK
jgi:solute carrier family 12 sodium/potassium/chloride transporter 2